MSDNETTKITDDEGNTWFEAIDGKRYKTRSGAWKRTQKLRAEGEVTEEPLEMPNDDPPVATEENPDFDGPDWAQFDMGDLPEGVQVIPSALKKVRRHGVKGRKRTKNEIEQEKQTNHSISENGLSNRRLFDDALWARIVGRSRLFGNSHRRRLQLDKRYYLCLP